MRRKSSLLDADPILFSPIRLNTDNISTDKLLAFYRFADLFFPRMGSGLVNTVLNMESHGERLTANCSPDERKRLIGKLRSLSMEMQFTLSDGGQSMLEMSVRIVPSEVLERAQQGRGDIVGYQRPGDDLDKLIARLVAKELNRRLASKVRGMFKVLAAIRQVPLTIAKLIGLSWADRDEQLLQGASIDDLLIGKYRAQFEQALPDELLHEGMDIRTTVATCFAISQYEAGSPIQGAKTRRALLEITIREASREQGHKHRSAAWRLGALT
jgi:hypothetical protein